MRKTKIICTIGPGCDNKETLKKMVTAGMNVARLNFSHSTHEEQLARINMVKELRAELGVPLAILLDTKGPEIRIGTFKNKKIMLEEGQKFTLTPNQIAGDETRVSITYTKLANFLKPGNIILVDDGLIELEVSEIKDNDIECIVNHGGMLSERKSINLPGINIEMPYMTDTDKNDILFGIKHDVDYIAASFVRSADDIAQVREFLDKNGGEDIRLIAKIENAEGVKNADEILALSNGIMVARGDLGVEIAFEMLPEIQKTLIKKCYEAGKIAVTATQMLESMVHNPRPTRAEVSDVANAVYDGTSAIMLSGETAAGEHPVESVETMAKIAVSTEDAINYEKRFLKENDIKNTSVTDAVSHAACTMAIDLHASAIIAVTKTAHTARMISKFRPRCPIIAAVVGEKTYHQASLNWGVVPVVNEIQTSFDGLFDSAIEKAKQTGLIKKGDTVIITGGSHIGEDGTDILKVDRI